MNQNWMLPWMNLWPGMQGSGEAPLSGDVSQLFSFFSPTVVNGAGDPALEREIVVNVATYGKQIGELSDVVLALAAKAGLESEASMKLKDIAAAVEAKKVEYRAGVLERARKALDELREHDEAGYTMLVANLAVPKGPKKSA